MASDSYERLKQTKSRIMDCQDLKGAQYDADAEREILIYWLLRAYQSGHREGWEDGPSTDETMDGILSVLANRGYDPNLSQSARELLAKPPRF